MKETKVKKALEVCTERKDDCRSCPYFYNDSCECLHEFHNDVLEVIQELESELNEAKAIALRSENSVYQGIGNDPLINELKAQLKAKDEYIEWYRSMWFKCLDTIYNVKKGE